MHLKIPNLVLIEFLKLMNVSKRLFAVLGIFSWLVITSCNNPPEKPKEKDIVEIPEQFDVHVKRNIQKNIEFILANKGRFNDTVLLKMDTLVNTLYSKNNYQPLWSTQENWLPEADSLLQFIEFSREYGLFPNDYHLKALQR